MLNPKGTIVVPPNNSSDVTNTPRERYESWAKSYDERTASFNWSAPQFLIKAVVNYAPPKGFLRVLDIGVGTGQASVPYLEVGATVTGLDVSPAMLRQAKVNYPQFHALIEHDFNRPLTEVGLSAQSFDIVISCGALHFAEDFARTLSELRWVIASGGLLAFSYIPPQKRTFSSATKPHTPKVVEDMLLQLGFNILEHQSFTAYYEGGDSSDPVCYQLVVAQCTQPGICLPEALQQIDRTACVDRSRLLSVVSQPLMHGSMTTQWTEKLSDISRENQYLVDALYSQIHAGEIEPRYLPLPTNTSELARKAKPLCDVLVLMPHPDDESIYAGGTIAALTEAGKSVRLVVATDGGAGRGGESTQLVTQRTDELRDAADILGIEQIESLGLVDFGKYRDYGRTQPITATDTLQTWGLDETLTLIVSKIRQHRPRVLLTLHPEADPNYSLHGHHLGLGVAALVAFHLAADPGFILKDATELAPWAVEEHHVMVPPNHNAGKVIPSGKMFAADGLQKNSIIQNPKSINVHPQGCGSVCPKDIIQNRIRRIEINRDRKLNAIQAHKTQHYSTQRLIESLKSDNPQANFEFLQVLQGRYCRTQVSAVSLPSSKKTDVSVIRRDWLSTYNAVRQRCYPRNALANLLQQQAQHWGTSPEVEANIEKIRDNKTVAVVTGQQVGILGGPAYTLYKALGAVKLARELETQGIPAVPIFWMASYDHDLDEVQEVEILSGHSQPDILNLNLPKAHSPVGSTQLGLSIYSLLDEIEHSFQDLPYSQEIIAALRRIYQPDTTFSKAFARWLSYLTKKLGLIILDPATREFSKLARDIVASELFNIENSQTALRQARQRLASQGDSEIINSDRDVLQIFCVDANGVRRRLRRVEKGFALQQTNVYLTNDTVREILEQQPERFTPSALLRPIFQDDVLPTIAYVAGPTEQKYFTQLHEVYNWASIPMPQIVARPSFTVIDGNTANLLNQAGGAVRLLCSDDAGSLIGCAGLPVEIRLICNQLNAFQQRCLSLLKLAKANQPVGDEAKNLQQDIEKWLAATAPLLKSWGAKRPVKAFNRSVTELPALAATVSLDLQRSGSPGNPPSTRNTANLVQKLASLERTIIKEGRQQNTPGVIAFNSISPNNAPQERHLSIAELIATHGVSIISHLLPISSPDFSQKRLITIRQFQH